MDAPSANGSARAEELFAWAATLPRGAGRDAFVEAECGNDPALRQELQSLLNAHDSAGDFLSEAVSQPVPEPPPAPPPHPSPLPKPANEAPRDAAAVAQEFLRETQAAEPSGVEECVASLPEDARRETRERIETGLRARRLGKRVSAVNAASAEEPWPTVPGFRVEGKRGEGGVGAVYEAHDEKLRRRVALKVLHRRADAALRRRVLEEARHAAALDDPAIVTIYSVLDENDPPAIVMELIEGFPLDRFSAHLPVQQKARLLREVARGLAAAHKRGIIHRDLKPDNVLVGPDHRPRLLDFGIALSLEEASRQDPFFEGTPLYASPEQVRGQTLTPASDVFAFGSLMFEVLTGRPPFAGETTSQVLEAIATTPPPFLRDVATGVPEDLQAICLACLAWDPAHRPGAAEVAVDLGRFLAGEPVRLKPRLYGDLLRRGVSEYAQQAQGWASQSIISREEHDALAVLHRRLLADEDHWIIDARRLTSAQTFLSVGAWLTVVATVLTVWMLRVDLGPLWRWLYPVGLTVCLLGAGLWARRARENLAAATFLAATALAIAPCTLALLAEFKLLSQSPAGVRQLFEGTFTNAQVLAASLVGLSVSTLAWWRLKMTGFAWTTAALATASYLSLLLLYDWLGRKPEIQAAWCLGLVALEPLALLLERAGRVRWTMPFHGVALAAWVGGLDAIAWHGPTLKLLGVTAAQWPYFDDARLSAFSFVLNGVGFLLLMLLTERSGSLDLRRAGRLLEILAILHLLTPLFVNALDHRGDAWLRVDVACYVGAALALVALGPIRCHWRLLVGGLLGCGLGSYLLVHLELVPRLPFILALGGAGLAGALGTFIALRRRHRSGVGSGSPRTS